MITIGLDVHRARTSVAALDESSGELLPTRAVPTAQLPELLSAMPGEVRVVMEAGTESMILARRLRSCLKDVTVVNCTAARQLLKQLSNAKTDRLDAEHLAVAHARGWLAHVAVWVPDQMIWELRGLTRSRIRLVRHRVGLQVQLRHTLAWTGHPRQGGMLTSAATQRWLDELPLGPSEAVMVQSLRSALAALEEPIEVLERQIGALAVDSEQCRLLRTVPGIGEVLAPTIWAEIGSIERFEGVEQLAGYCGLAPQVRQSGDRERGRGLQQEGNRWLRWALVEAAQHFVNQAATRELALTEWFRRLAARKHRNVAKVAVARALTRVIYAMLRDRTPFEPMRV